MLKIIIDIVKPSLKVGLRRFKEIMGTATATKYNEDPIELLDAVEGAYDEITINRGKTHDSYMSDLFKALKTFKNKVFVDFIIMRMPGRRMPLMIRMRKLTYLFRRCGQSIIT